MDMIALSAVLALPNNPKSHDVGAIHTSIEQYGFLDPLIINRTTGHILAGHGRVKSLAAMKEAGSWPPYGVTEKHGEWFLPWYPVDVEESVESAAAVALNRTVELGGWDTPSLANILQGLSERDALPGTGFDVEDLDDMMRMLTTPDGQMKLPEERMIGFTAGNLKQMVLYYDPPTYDRLTSKAKLMGYDNHSTLVKDLVDRAWEKLQ